MKSLGYIKNGSIDQVAFMHFERPEPLLRDHDVLVHVKAASVNPVDTKVRKSRAGTEENPVILGWDAAGVIEKVGPKVIGFNIGDAVFYAGEINRDGSNAELQAVDSRIIAHKPASLHFTEAAALPLTALTAWEALLEPAPMLYSKDSKVLIIAGAGGVGSIAIQLLKALTPAQVIATAARKETKVWAQSMGADLVLDHSQDLREGLQENDIPAVDLVFGTSQTLQYKDIVPDLLKPFGHFVVIDDPESLDIVPFKRKALRVHWEAMFAKTLFQHAVASQGRILNQIRQLVEKKAIKTTLHSVLHGLTEQNLKTAHTLLESGKSLGKIVIDLG